MVTTASGASKLLQSLVMLIILRKKDLTVIMVMRIG